ncbi:MAG: thiamine phosphate synthase [Peptococcaceae bacterium]|nr:thiamine phosphate synthase [Peptococcaceae bacterium]
MRTDRPVFKGIYGITAAGRSLGRTNIDVVSLMLACGIRIIQYREKEKSLGEMYDECMSLMALIKDAGGFLIVNDHPSLALAVEADGVHIGQDDLPLSVVRTLVGPDMIIGVSTHSPVQARAAVAQGADYIGVGPIYPTATKKDVVDAVGLPYLDWVAANINLPFVAIGGIKESNLGEVVAHGASCAALVTEITETYDIPAMIIRLRAIMKAGSTTTCSE